MTVNIEIPEDLAPRFQKEAQARGLTVDQWLLELAAQNAPAGSIAHLQKTDPQEWARHFDEWINSHDSATPVLSGEAMSRESIYPDRV